MNTLTNNLGHIAIFAGCVLIAAGMAYIAIWATVKVMFSIYKKRISMLPMCWVIEATHSYAKTNPPPNGTLLVPLPIIDKGLV